jgi:hypothetical protein
MATMKGIIGGVWIAAGLLLAGQAAADFAEEEQFGSGATIPVAWGDYDNDGDPDVAVGNFNQANQLFINEGDGTFTEEAQFGVGATFAVAWGDYDNDGDADLAVGNGTNQQNKLFINNGDGSFTEDDQFGMNRTCAVAWGDVDNDGDLDLAVGNGIFTFDQQNYLYLNNGDGSFSEEAQFGAGKTGSVVWGDFDDDGDLDLAVGNGGFQQEGQNALYINNGDGSFTERPEFGMGDTACMFWGDADHDGDLDLAVGNWDAGQSMLYLNDGGGTFSPLARFGARDTNTLAWGDVDNDGDLDVAVGNGDFQTADSNYVYLNDGAANFVEEAEFGLGSTDGVAFADYDGDGDLDLASGNEHSPPRNYLYVNDENRSGYLIVRLVGHVHDLGPGFSNRDGIGAKVAVYEDGFLGDADHLLGYRVIAAHGGFASQNHVEAHFGLPGVSFVDLRVTWPGSGGDHIVQDIESVATDQRIQVDEAGPSTGIATPPAISPEMGLLRVAPNPIRGSARIELAGAGHSVRRVDVHNVMGQIVRTLRTTESDPGEPFHFQWDGRMSDGRFAPAGFYLIRASGDHPLQAARVLLVR